MREDTGREPTSDIGRPHPVASGEGRAWFRAGPGTADIDVGTASARVGTLAEGVVEHATDPSVLDRGGWWAVVMTFEGQLDLWRFATVRPAPLPRPEGCWIPVPDGAWTTSLDRAGYVTGVRMIRSRIREGDVYQVNLCRVIDAPVDAHADPWVLAARVAEGNPAPYAGVIDIPMGISGGPVRVVSASPELFLGRDGDRVTSSPIKGTGATDGELLPKDDAENIMIVDLVRNDLQRVCLPGSVEVTSLLRREQHPGLVHLVSTVSGRLAPTATWADLLAATTPPGSVSGAPKSSALQVIAEQEPVERGPYCGAVGWVDADAGQACLAVGIRTFWWREGRILFGTGAGITWGSDADREWEETCLKARRLISLTSRQGRGGETGDVAAVAGVPVGARRAHGAPADAGRTNGRTECRRTQGVPAVGGGA